MLSHANVTDILDRRGVPELETLLIALNVFGIRTKDKFLRARFILDPESDELEPSRIILPFGRVGSPFEMREGSIWFHDRFLGRVCNFERDTTSNYYFRKNGQVVTINTNKRSSCVGCSFCHYYLEKAEDEQVIDMDGLLTLAESIAEDCDWPDLSRLEIVTLSTGCFDCESDLLKHLKDVKVAFGAYGFRGTLNVLTSVLRSSDGLQYAAEELAPFYLTLTIECFDDRRKRLRASKATLTREAILTILETARAKGIRNDFTYLVGLDSYHSTIDGLRELGPLVSDFPRLQLYQPHTDKMESQRIHEARSLEYYIDVRQEIEGHYAPLGLTPRSWQNYRPLWFYEFAGGRLCDERI